MTTFHPQSGTDIRSACITAVVMADASGLPVTFDFNGVTMVVQPGEQPSDVASRWDAAFEANCVAYRNSPEGKAAEAERAARQERCQRETDALIARLPNVTQDMTALVRWLVALSESADHAGVKWSPLNVADTIEAAGWKADAQIGRPKEDYAEKTVMGEYLIGQSLVCLREGRSPHRMVERFAREGGFLRNGRKS